MQMILTNSIDPKVTLKCGVSSRHTPFAMINILLIINGRKKHIFHVVLIIEGLGGYDVNITALREFHWFSAVALSNLR